MAIYSLHLGFISRSHGRSSVGFSAYISGSRGLDERTGVSFDYSRKAEVVGGRVLAPREAPPWVRDPAVLWNRVEAFEDYLADLRFRGGEKSMAALETPEALIHEVSLKRATFTKRHVEDEIIRRVGGDPQLFSQLKSSMDSLDGAHVYDAYDMQEVMEGY